MLKFNAQIAWGTILFTAVTTAIASFNAVGQIQKNQSQNPAPNLAAQSASNVPKSRAKIFRLSISLSRPEDLKVSEGATVVSGQILADRAVERFRLEEDKKQLNLQLKKIEGSILNPPIKPLEVPAIPPLPAANFQEQEAQILAAQIRIRETQIALDLQKRNLQMQPLKESSELDRARATVLSAKRKVEIQQAKLDRISSLELPEAVGEHESKQLEKAQLELQQAEAEERVASANLEQASLNSAEKERSLLTALESAKSELELSRARLQTARENRGYREYEWKLNQSRRIEERNQAELSYSQQLSEFQERQRNRDFQIAQLKGKIQEVEAKLAELATVRSPYSGTVRRIKYERQENQNLKATITLDLSPPANRSNSPDPSRRWNGTANGREPFTTRGPEYSGTDPEAD